MSYQKERIYDMKKIICKICYDTEFAEVEKRFSIGNFGDSDGYEEVLYKTEDGSYFIYTNGGKDSKYCKEDIKRASRAAAEKWLAEH